MPYATPPADLIPVVDAPPPPSVSMAPGGRYLVLVHYAAHPEIAMLARPYLALAGLRIDQRLRARRRLRRAGRLSVLRIADGHEYFPRLPEGAQVGFPVWAADGRRFAFTVDRPGGVGLWIGDAETGEVTELPGLSLCDVLGGEPASGGGTVRWSRDGRSLLVLACPPGSPVLPEPATEPRLEETEGKRSQLATYQDLLRTGADEDRFEVLATSVPARVDPASGESHRAWPARALLHPAGLAGRDPPAGAAAAAAVLVPRPLGVVRPLHRGLGQRRQAACRDRGSAGQ